MDPLTDFSGCDIFNIAGTKAGILQENWVNTRDADVLVTGVTRSSAIMTLAILDKCPLPSTRNDFNQLCNFIGGKW